MKVLVCGGRDYADYEELAAVLRKINNAHGITLIIEGGAMGADFLAFQWAKEAGIPILSFKADWKRWGTAAGPVRNQQMMDEGKPDLVVAFPGGRGTADMVGRARQHGIPVEGPGAPD